MSSKTISKRGPSKKKPAPPAEFTRVIGLDLAAPGLSSIEVAKYVQEAIEQWSGCLQADDPRRNVRVVRVWRLGWIDVGDDSPMEISE